MITTFDDYPIHQVPVPLAHPGTSDRNFYDRYWFNGFDVDGAFVFEAGLGIYPNRFVLDAHFSVAVGGEQHCFHTSRRAPIDRTETRSGPLRLEVVTPMRALRLVIEPNDTGIECDLVFRARSLPHQEEPSRLTDGVRLVMDTTRFTQFGVFEGHFTVAGKRTEVRPERTRATRDRSWGVRPVGEPEFGAPSRLTTDPAIYWVWSPIHFPDVGLHFATMEDPRGKPMQLAATLVPLVARESALDGDGVAPDEPLARPSHTIHWEKGTRRSRGAVVRFEREDKPVEVILDPIARFQMKALGYQHSEWGHGMWRDELDVGSETLVHADLDPEDYSNIHVHQIVRARMGDRVGVGTLETIVFGRHEPSGFEDFFDGAK